MDNEFIVENLEETEEEAAVVAEAPSPDPDEFFAKSARLFSSGGMRGALSQYESERRFVV